MELIHSITFAVIQGVTEFLPVSSSGHLLIVQHFINFSGDKLRFDIIVHLGTLLATIIFFFADIKAILINSLKEFAKREYGQHAAFLVLVIIANVPAGIVGIFFKHSIEKIFEVPIITSIMFIATACFLRQFKSVSNGKYSIFEIPYMTALLIGIAQAMAILPGVSRSGLTITTAVLLLVMSKDAGKFSFLISIPAISGAFILEAKDIENFNHLFNLNYITAFIVAFIIGLLSLRVLTAVINNNKFHLFSIYLFIVGSLSLLYFTFSM